MVDLNKLTSLLGNDKHIIGRFLDLYIEKMPDLIDKLDYQLKNENYIGANITAHEIKSQSAYLNLEDIVTLAGKIENQTEEASGLKPTKKQFIELKHLLTTAMNEIKATR